MYLMSDSTDRLKIETNLWWQGYERVMGLDEVGRGCLSGPVVAAGVILKREKKLTGLRDSKKLSGGERVRLARIIEDEAEFWTVATCDPEEIDRLNILRASIQAMLRCSLSEGADPDYLLVDGNRFTSTLVPCSCVVRGDDRSDSIAAASILAKVYRDELMKKLHEKFPWYGWDTNVGYPTKSHYDGLKKFGYTQHHRKSFRLNTDRPFGSNGDEDT